MQLGKHNLFYGWIIAVCCMIMCTATSLCSSAMGTNLAAIKAIYHFTGAQTSLIITIRSVSALVFTFFANRYFELIGLKRGMIVAMLSGAAAFVLFGFSGSNLWMYYIASAVTGITYAYGLILPSSLILRRWFNKSIGIALAIASCGTGLVSIIFTPIIQLIINNYGIMDAFFCQAGFFIFTAILLLLVIVERPEEKGLTAYGGEYKEENVTYSHPELSSLETKWVIALVIATVLVGMSSSPAVSHYTLHYTTAGIDPMDVAKAMSVYGLIILLSKLCLGRVIDKFGILKSTIVYSAVTGIGMMLIALIEVIPTIPWMYLGLIVTAASAVIQTLGYPNWISKLDMNHYAKSVSKCQLGYQIGVFAGSMIPGLIADATGSYSPAYVIFGIAMFLSGAIVVVVFARNSK